MEFEASERAYLNDMRMLSTDNKGREVFVGLTIEESEEYFLLTRLDSNNDGDREKRDRYLELYEKHETARLAVLGAENAARRDPSPRH